MGNCWLLGQGAKRAYRHTAPVNGIRYVRSTSDFKGRRLRNAWQRHALGHEKLAQGLSELGLELTVDSACRLPQLNVVKIPDGVDDTAVRKQLLEDFNLEIAPV